MIQPTLYAAKRPGLLAGSTLFALTLAILAGLVGAYLFKTYYLNAKAPAPQVQPDGSLEIYALAANLTDNVILQPYHFRKVKVSKEDYERFRSQETKYGTMLFGQNQAVGCVTKEKVKADEPIYENQIVRLEYPVPVSTRLRPGMRAVVVKIPADAAMVQVDDRVDLLCTISNPDFGLGQTATARLAKDAKVVARFNTTRAGALPTPNDPNRTYTLEVTPYRHGLIEVAKSLGGVFSLSVAYRAGKDKGLTPTMVETVPDPDPDTDRVTSADLAKLFGIHSASLPVASILVVERFKGVSQQNSLRFQSVVPAGTPTPTPTPNSSSQPPSAVAPGGYVPLPPGPVTAVDSTAGSAAAMTAFPSDSNAFGFRPPSSSAPGCKTCGKK